MSCHLPVHVSRNQMLTFLPNFLSLLLDQAPCLFVSPDEHHFTSDGYWIDDCCHGPVLSLFFLPTGSVAYLKRLTPFLESGL